MCFFFQAEDGIRDLTVTGVQTCALPICPLEVRLRQDRRRAHAAGGDEPRPRAVPEIRPDRPPRGRLRRMGRRLESAHGVLPFRVASNPLSRATLSWTMTRCVGGGVCEPEERTH